MEDDVTLNAKEQRRLLVLNQLESGALTNEQAAELLELSVRQVRRLRSRYREQGAAALAHGNRGRPATNAVNRMTSARIVGLARRKQQGFNQRHLTEMPAEHEDTRLSLPVRRILLQAGIERAPPPGFRPPLTPPIQRCAGHRSPNAMNRLNNVALRATTRPAGHAPGPTLRPCHHLEQPAARSESLFIHPDGIAPARGLRLRPNVAYDQRTLDANPAG